MHPKDFLAATPPHTPQLHADNTTTSAQFEYNYVTPEFTKLVAQRYIDIIKEVQRKRKQNQMYAQRFVKTGRFTWERRRDWPTYCKMCEAENYNNLENCDDCIKKILKDRKKTAIDKMIEKL